MPLSPRWRSSADKALHRIIIYMIIMYYLHWVILDTNLHTCPQAPLMQLN
ncbi:hypothetical protein HMPREF1121_00680 [Porphyromonas sp. KLE 1280]|nr:hypothetical protein HMPREF1121_00680 [Porphyromonas sp. KLE 1280]